jgi:Fe-S cluster assembly scaffold protein SufB
MTDFSGCAPSFGTAHAYVHYVEGCTAPIYSSDSLHSAVVEIVVKNGGRCRYTTIQNWSNNVYNLVTKRAVAYKDATMEWVDGNLGSKLTMKYPASTANNPTTGAANACSRTRRPNKLPRFSGPRPRRK